MSLRVGQTSGERETEMRLPLCGIGRVARQSKSEQNGEVGVNPEEGAPPTLCRALLSAMYLEPVHHRDVTG
jgi:hypothetical protein